MRIPPHWSVAGWHRVSRDGLARLLRARNVRGAHVSDVYRLVRIGPISLMVFRYRPGHVEEEN